MDESADERPTFEIAMDRYFGLDADQLFKPQGDDQERKQKRKRDRVDDGVAGSKQTPGKWKKLKTVKSKE